MRFPFLLFASIVIAACTPRVRSDIYPDVARESNKEIAHVRVVGGEPFDADTLLSMIDTRPSRCELLGLPVCLPLLGGKKTERLNVEVVRRDVARLAAFYRREGYFGTRVLPRAVPAAKNTDQEVDVTYLIQRGDPIQLDTFTIDGAEGAVSADSITRELPLQPGNIFNIAKFEASADYLLRELQSRGFAYADLLRNYSVDTVSNRATASLSVIPGVQVRVDSVIVRGAEHLGGPWARRQITFQRGDLLRLPALVESQRNLYSLEIVQLASVAIAPDSLQLSPGDSSTATVLVSIAEAPANQVEAAFGYGDVDCFRAETSWLNRSFGGGARRMSVQASVSKVGLGGFTDLGLDKTLCTQFQQDSSFSKTLDYRLAGEYTLPYFFSPRNQFNIGIYTERISEPTVYSRQAYGGQVGVTHRLKARRIINASVELARIRTIASPVLFCSAFQICIPEQIDRLTQSRVRNTFSVNYADDHTDNPIDPTQGHTMRSTVAYATPWLSSSVSFVRWTGDAAYYWRLGHGNVLALSARFGNFFRTASLDPDAATRDFVPPEERFFAGGATTVRGYARNQLGGGVYLTTSSLVNDSLIAAGEVGADFIPTGGTSLGIINAEVRVPSPIFARQIRLAAFLDAGMVGNRNLWHIGRDQWRFTPGVGARATTPVGPIRVDVAYNGYPPVAGPLFQAQDKLLVPVDPNFRPSSGGFFSRFRLQVGIGQAF